MITSNKENEMNDLSWVKGRIESTEIIGDFAIIHHGGKAFSVVNHASREYFGCCPSRKYAARLVAEKAGGAA